MYCVLNNRQVEVLSKVGEEIALYLHNQGRQPTMNYNFFRHGQIRGMIENRAKEIGIKWEPFDSLHYWTVKEVLGAVEKGYCKFLSLARPDV